MPQPQQYTVVCETMLNRTVFDVGLPVFDSQQEAEQFVESLGQRDEFGFIPCTDEHTIVPLYRPVRQW